MRCFGFAALSTASIANRVLSHRLKLAASGLFALFALIALSGARAAFAQDAATSGDADANWERVDSGSTADSGDQVLEIPQVACGDDASVPCDDGANASNSPNNDDDGIPTDVAVQPAAPQTYDDDTASAGSDAGNADDYAVYGYPYGAGTYGGVATGVTINGNPSQIRRPAFPFSPLSTSSPVTQAATPPLNTGPWMMSPSTMMFSRAGSSMAGAPFRFH
jgi:hypothetical protein